MNNACGEQRAGNIGICRCSGNAQVFIEYMQCLLRHHVLAVVYTIAHPVTIGKVVGSCQLQPAGRARAEQVVQGRGLNFLLLEFFLIRFVQLREWYGSAVVQGRVTWDC